MTNTPTTATRTSHRSGIRRLVAGLALASTVTVAGAVAPALAGAAPAKDCPVPASCGSDARRAGAVGDLPPAVGLPEDDPVVPPTVPPTVPPVTFPPRGEIVDPALLDDPVLDPGDPVRPTDTTDPGPADPGTPTRDPGPATPEATTPDTTVPGAMVGGATEERGAAAAAPAETLAFTGSNLTLALVGAGVLTLGAAAVAVGSRSRRRTRTA